MTFDPLPSSTRVLFVGQVGFATLEADGTYSVRLPGGKTTARGVLRDALVAEELTAFNLTDDEIRAWESDLFEDGNHVEKRAAVDDATFALGPVATSRDYVGAYGSLLESAGFPMLAREANDRRRGARERIVAAIGARSLSGGK